MQAAEKQALPVRRLNTTIAYSLDPRRQHDVLHADGAQPAALRRVAQLLQQHLQATTAAATAGPSCVLMCALRLAGVGVRAVGPDGHGAAAHGGGVTAAVGGQAEHLWGHGGTMCKSGCGKRTER